MTKEEIFKNKFEYVVLPNREDVLDCMQEYADQETERLKAELVKTIETAKATSVTQRQHIERLQNELNELKERHKKDSVDFAEWITISGYYQLRRQEWTINILGEENKIYTSEQLYELYKQKF